MVVASVFATSPSGNEIPEQPRGGRVDAINRRLECHFRNAYCITLH